MSRTLHIVDYLYPPVRRLPERISLEAPEFDAGRVGTVVFLPFVMHLDADSSCFVLGAFMEGLRILQSAVRAIRLGTLVYEQPQTLSFGLHPEVPYYWAPVIAFPQLRNDVIAGECREGLLTVAADVVVGKSEATVILPMQRKERSYQLAEDRP
ncbi:MAG TPA: hypothetical protein VGO11_13770 [Chthoniobacteraceae bacterium]|jgi:hypothetical protein|nr:hypothetical protein [Chthoniobacteraceae bacterium]